MAHRVAGESFEKLTGQLFEIERQLRQKSGYPFDPEGLKRHLQAAIEGEFVVLPDYLLSVEYFIPPKHGEPIENQRDVVRIDLRKIRLVTVDYSPNEGHIKGKEALRRLRNQAKRDKFTLLDVRVLEELLKRPYLIPEEWKQKDSPTFLSSPYFVGGIIAKVGNNAPVLAWAGGHWYKGYSGATSEEGTWWMPKNERVAVLMNDT